MLFLAGTGPSHDLVVKAERPVWKGKHGLTSLLNLIIAMVDFFDLFLPLPFFTLLYVSTRQPVLASDLLSSLL